jgi:hypothetical protein
LNPAKFRAASKAAGGWFNTLSLVADYGEIGNVDLAYTLLMGKKGARYSLTKSYNEHEKVLAAQFEALARLNDKPVDLDIGRRLKEVVKGPSALIPPIWSSVHEAAVGMADLAIRRLVAPLEGVKDGREQFDIAEALLAYNWRVFVLSGDEIGRLQERIRWERAKVLTADFRPEEPANSKSRQKKPGRKSKPEYDAKILKVYEQGLEDRLWDGQTDYLRKRHKTRVDEDLNRAKAWLSTLLKRARKRSGRVK